MSPDGEPVTVDPSTVVTVKRKTTKSSRSWISIDTTGQRTVLDEDKYAIMHRVQIHARDLRILDPNLSYPSAILRRERAIVLNLEVGLGNFLFSLKFFKVYVMFHCFICFVFGSGPSGAAYQGHYHCSRGQ